MKGFRKRLTMLILMLFVLANSSLVVASVLNISIYEVVEEEVQSEVAISESNVKNSFRKFRLRTENAQTRILSVSSYESTALPNSFAFLSEKYLLFRSILI